MEKFEYKIITVNRYKLKKSSFQAEVIEKLNALGNEGWELVNVEGLVEPQYFFRFGGTSDLLYTFKRNIF